MCSNRHLNSGLLAPNSRRGSTYGEIYGTDKSRTQLPPCVLAPDSKCSCYLSSLGSRPTTLPMPLRAMKEQPDGVVRSPSEQATGKPKQRRGVVMSDSAPASPADSAEEHEEDLELNSSPGRSASDATQLSPIAPFVSKTYGIINGESEDIVSWWKSAGEDTFVIKRVEVFQEQVLPRFFSHKNYSSFVRQLNNHGKEREG